MTCRLRIGCTANCATVAYLVSGGDYKGNHINPQGKVTLRVRGSVLNILILKRGYFALFDESRKFFASRVV